MGRAHATGRSYTCKHCGKLVYGWTGRNGKFYLCDSRTNGTLFHSKTCDHHLDAALVNAPPTTTPNGYTIDLAKNYCSCPSWQFQKVPADQRTCKHLEEARKAS